MKIATWNVNGIRARQGQLLEWLATEKPDIVCLQEIKASLDQLPFELRDVEGYWSYWHGEKGYSGVAVLFSKSLANVFPSCSHPNFDFEQRIACATIASPLGDIMLASIYVPNGGEVGSEKWAYKTGWLKRLQAFAASRLDLSARVAICGDINIAPEARDVAKPDRWKNSVLFHPEMSAAFADLLARGLVDTTRLHHAGEGPFTWWDYRMLAFPKGDGLRIDHIFASKPLAALCTEVRVDREERKGAQPSDHAPLIAVFS